MQALKGLIEDGWRQGNDERWRNDRFGGAYKTENALQRLGSHRGEVTKFPDDDGITETQKVYELVDGAAQTVAIYANRKAADAHVADDQTLEVVERTVWPEYVPVAHSWRD